jgi:hypothetical protein
MISQCQNFHAGFFSGSNPYWCMGWFSRLGLGAKYLSHSQANRVSSQVEKKLRAKLITTATAGTGYQGGRREHKASNREEEEEAVQAEDEHEDDSRALNFKKRSSAFIRPTLIVSETAGSKKKKKKGP